MDDKKQPIVVKKIIKKGGHHGGAWKIAFADFATAMMAFFLLLWILGFTDETQKAAISEYFENPSATIGASQAPSTSPVQGPGGASTSMIDLGGSMELYSEPPQQLDEQTVEELAEQAEAKRLEELLAELEAAIEKSQALKPFKDQLLLDITPEGLRIQIVDKENRSMFSVGSARLQPYTREILHDIAQVINEVPNKISITGHTDARPYPGENYGNWELSADRANAARRELVQGGLKPDKVGRVVGLASSVLFNQEDPYSPINRRISIIVMNKRTEETIAHEGAMEETGTAPVAEPQ
jgi:chemotaxis protein MotB